MFDQYETLENCVPVFLKQRSELVWPLLLSRLFDSVRAHMHSIANKLYSPPIIHAQLPQLKNLSDWSIGVILKEWFRQYGI